MSDDVLGAKLHSTMDAVIWADEFCKLNPSIDQDLMRAWFANAIMVGWDHAHQRRLEPMRSALDALYKRHLWSPTTGECICEAHAVAAEWLGKP